MQYTQKLSLSLDPSPLHTHNFLLKLLFSLSLFQIGLIICNSNLTSPWAIYDFYDIFYNIVIMIFGLCHFKSAQLYGTLVFWGLVSVPAKLLYGVLWEAFRLKSFDSMVFHNAIDALQSSIFAPTYLNFFLITLTSWKLVLLTLILIFHAENDEESDDDDKKIKDSDEKILEKKNESEMIDLA